MEENSKKIKLGIALSGGGFRAALFHVGVLARLSQLDLLRKVDVISSVSGGSIIAAYLYLKIKALLEQSSDNSNDAPNREAYIRLMREIEADFLAAVQKNMRMRTFLDPGKSARMMGEDYSNTERLAELFTHHFYKPIFQQKGTETKRHLIPLKDLSIKPSINPLPSQTRIPFLIINATSLNTGHLWQFTVTSIGEAPTGYMADYGHTRYLKKFRLDDELLTIEQRKILYNITLGQAVAASSCVPGILEPLQIKHLYRAGNESLTVRLVDGGLVDNQGLASLYGERCTHIICSDASDILKPEPNPSVQFLNVAQRANDILMERIRSKSLSDLYQYDPRRYALIYMGDQATRQDIFPADSEKIVRALSRIRTDMDSFTDLEAYALMYYGYQLSGKVLKTNEFELIDENQSYGTPDWRFIEIHDRFLIDDDRRKELLHHLNVGSRPMFKVFMLNKLTPYVIALPLPIFVVLFVLFFIIKTSPMTFWLILLCAALVLVYTQNTRILQLMDNVAFLRKIKDRILKVLISLRLPEPLSYILAIISWIQLTIFDRLFLRYGRIRNESDKKFLRNQKR